MLNQRGPRGVYGQAGGCAAALVLALAGKIISSDAPTGPAMAMATNAGLEPYLALRLRQENVPGGLIDRIPGQWRCGV